MRAARVAEQPSSATRLTERHQMQMFSDEILKRATVQPAKPRWLERVVSWWRRTTGRDRYYIGTDPAADGGCYWVKSVYDTKTGIITVLETGKSEPPANESSSQTGATK
jgi:hypothetical protein